MKKLNTIMKRQKFASYPLGDISVYSTMDTRGAIFGRKNAYPAPRPWSMGGKPYTMVRGLFHAIHKCRLRKVKYLLDNGIPINSVNEEGQNTLITALKIDDEIKRLKMLKFLLRRGADCSFVDKTTGRDVLSWACYIGKSNDIALILDVVLGDVNFCQKDNLGLTPLHHATRSGNTEAVRSIVKAMQKFGLSVDLPDGEGLTPLLTARRMGFSDISGVLLEDGNANAEQFDSNKFRSIDQWAQIGVRERLVRAKRDKALANMSNRMRGKLTPLASSAYVVPKVKVTFASKTDSPSSHISTTDVTSSTNMTVRSDIVAPDNKDSMDGPTVLPAINSSEQSPFTSKSLDTALELLDYIAEPQSQPTEFVQSQLDVNKAKEYVNPVDVAALMTILADQKSSSFRTVAKKIVIPPPVKPMKEAKKSQVSTLAIIFGKNGRGGSSRRRRTYSASNRGRSNIKNTKKRKSPEKKQAKDSKTIVTRQLKPLPPIRTTHG